MATGSGCDTVRIVELAFEIIFIFLVIGLYVPYYVSQNNDGNNTNRVPTKQISVTGVASQSNSTNQPAGQLSAMSPSFGPIQPRLLFSAIEQSMATDTPYDATQDPQARFFDVKKNLSSLKRDKVEYVEILSKQVTMQSANVWLPAKIANINDSPCEIDVKYYVFTSQEGCKMTGKKERLNLTQGADSARFRVPLFGCPKPYKLPMDKKFGIPKILVQLMNKLLDKKIRGDKEVGIFRVSADKMKYLDYKIAICQYDIDNYDYRLGGDFKDQASKQKHSISALIKDWIRQFPETIVKYDYTSDKLEANVTGSKNDTLKAKLFELLEIQVNIYNLQIY